ncbi:MAG: hypothetical protein KAI18_04385 [Candidatus Aenigmarchaeota archaeon]|nr:hypothetical protein [Candidatus Aenigmarchaeota archaeon]
MDNYKIVALMVLFVFLVSPAYAQVEMIEDMVMPISIDDENARIDADISFAVEIDDTNMETSEYSIDITNSGNESVEGYVEIYMAFIPETIEVLVDDEKVDVITQEESYRNSRYRVKIDMDALSNSRVDINYEILKTPQQWNVGLWALQYNYNSPINLQFSTTKEDYIRTDINYDGTIVIGYEPSKLSCNNCVQDGNTITVEDSNYFYVNWEKKRVPYRAGILYILMIAGIVYYLVKMRK